LDPIAAVRHSFEAFRAKDFDAVLEFVDEEWRCIPGPRWVSPGTSYHGHAGYRSMLSHLGLPGPEFDLEVEVRRVDGYVLAVGSVRVGAGERPSSSHAVASLHTVVDGRLRWTRGFADERAALSAVRAPSHDDLEQRPAESPAGVLTPRQREVLGLLASGLTGPETAERLFVSRATVRTHVQNARAALGAKTGTQAVAEALIRGEIDWPSADSTGDG
jgi:DNA-binding CsgD family transcriptional regulator/ketosteroid isomerase-like protein